MPRCPHCDASVRLTDIHTKPQTRDQFIAGRDSYVCKAGHEFEATIPLKNKNGYAIRGDM